MDYTKLESEIMSRVKTLNSSQKYGILDYLEELPKSGHSTRIYRRKGMKQIREALKNL